jgi:hypothetical protein
MASGWKDWNKNDVIYGIIVPIIVGLLIVGVSQLSSFFTGDAFGITVGITSEIEELLVIVAIPLMFGLVWNRWAGGASGFIMGTFYALAFASKLPGATGVGRDYMMPAYLGLGPVMLGYIISAMLIGYMAGALIKNSEDFKRMLLVSLLTTTIVGVVLFGIYQISPTNVVLGLSGFLLTVLARTATGAIVAVLAKVAMWYGVAMKKPTGHP